jgi:hypothetical protein
VATGRYGVEELAEHGPAAVFADLTDTEAVVAAIVREAEAQEEGAGEAHGRSRDRSHPSGFARETGSGAGAPPREAR